MKNKLTSEELLKINGGVVAGAAGSTVGSGAPNASGVMNNTSGVLNNTSSGISPSFDSTSSLSTTGHPSFNTPMGDQSLTPTSQLNASLNSPMTNPVINNGVNTGLTGVNTGIGQTSSLAPSAGVPVSPGGMATTNNPGPGGMGGSGIGGSVGGGK